MVVRTVVIGAGTVSRTHLSGIRKNPRAELVGVCDTDEEAANRRAREFGTAAVTDLDRALEMEPDAFHVCTPVQTHFDIAQRAIENGVAVILEKPATVTVEEVERLAQQARSKGVPATVVHNHLFYPSVRKARRLIESGELGELRGISTIYSGFTPPDCEQRGSWVFDLPGGEFEEGLPHPIYSTLGLGGFPASSADISAQTALSREYEGGFSYDQAQVQYRSADGTLCSVNMFSRSLPQRLYVVDGADQSLVVDEINQSVRRIDEDYSASALARSKKALDASAAQLSSTIENATMVAASRFDGDWANETRTNSHYAVFDQFTKAVEGDGEVPAPLEQSKWTIRIMEEIREATRTDAPERDESATVSH